MNGQMSYPSRNPHAQFKTSAPLTVPRQWLAIAVISAVAVMGLGSPGASAAPPERVPGRLLVKVKTGVPELAVQTILARHGAREQGAIPQIGVRIVNVSEKTFERVLTALKQNPKFEWAEPDYLFEPALTPNDPYYSFEWHLPKIGAPAAWDITTGSADVIVAILAKRRKDRHLQGWYWW